MTQTTNLHTALTWRATALLLAMLLLLPSGLAFAHNFENHDHIDRCELSADVHMHENDIDCDLDHIVLHKVGVFAFAKATLDIQPCAQTAITLFTSLYFGTALDYSASRGPPQISN